MNEKKLDNLSQPDGVRCDESTDNVSWTSDIIVSRLCTHYTFDCGTVVEIQNKVIK